MPAPTSKKKDRSHLNPEVQQARNILRRRGWTQLEVAERLGVTRTHIVFVLNGRRTSKRILNAIAELPDNPNPA